MLQIGQIVFDALAENQVQGPSASSSRSFVTSRRLVNAVAILPPPYLVVNSLQSAKSGLRALPPPVLHQRGFPRYDLRGRPSSNRYVAGGRAGHALRRLTAQPAPPSLRRERVQGTRCRWRSLRSRATGTPEPMRRRPLIHHGVVGSLSTRGALDCDGRKVGCCPPGPEISGPMDQTLTLH